MSSALWTGPPQRMWLEQLQLLRVSSKFLTMCPLFKILERLPCLQVPPFTNNALLNTTALNANNPFLHHIMNNFSLSEIKYGPAGLSYLLLPSYTEEERRSCLLCKLWCVIRMIQNKRRARGGLIEHIYFNGF